MGNWLKGRVLINDVSLTNETTQQSGQVASPSSNYQVSLNIDRCSFALIEKRQTQNKQLTRLNMISH